MSNPWIAALIALFLWWFSTGAILWVVTGADRRRDGGHLCSVILGLPLLLLGVHGASQSLTDPSIQGIYIAFLSALAIWGWIELAFLSGIITGPNRHPSPDGTTPWERFRLAWGTIAYHEVLLVAVLLLLAWTSRGAENQFAFWTFGVLFFARISAKLNLFFGVPKINIAFLPSTLSHLPSHFRQDRINPAFPLSVTLLALAVACWLERIVTAGTPADSVGFALLATLTALALLEHWLMVLPLADEKLWRWMMPAPKPQNKRLLSEDPHGL